MIFEKLNQQKVAKKERLTCHDSDSFRPVLMTYDWVLTCVFLDDTDDDTGDGNDHSQGYSCSDTGLNIKTNIYN